MKTSLIIMVSVVAIFFSVASSAYQSATEMSPEMILVLNSVKLTGKQLSTDQMRVEMNKLLVDYNKTAPIEQRSERLTQALIQAGVMTEKNAIEFRAQIEQAMKEEVALGHDKNAAIDKVTKSVLIKISGAEYSNCDSGGMIGVLGAMGLIFSIDQYNSSYTTTTTETKTTNGNVVTKVETIAGDNFYLITGFASVVVLVMDLQGDFCN